MMARKWRSCDTGGRCFLADPVAPNCGGGSDGQGSEVQRIQVAVPCWIVLPCWMLNDALLVQMLTGALLVQMLADASLSASFSKSSTDGVEGADNKRGTVPPRGDDHPPRGGAEPSGGPSPPRGPAFWLYRSRYGTGSHSRWVPGGAGAIRPERLQEGGELRSLGTRMHMLQISPSALIVCS